MNPVVFVLLPMDNYGKPSITMRLVVTVSGNLPDTSQNVRFGLSQASAQEAPIHASLSSVHEQPTSDAEAEVEAENASPSLITVNTRLALRMDDLPSAQVPAAADTVADLASILLHLDEFVKIVDLSPDVCILGFHSGFDSLIVFLALCLDPHFG